MPKTKTEINYEDFVPLRQAAIALSISNATLQRRIKDGEFKEGIHWCDRGSSNSKLPRYFINVKKVKELWLTPACKR